MRRDRKECRLNELLLITTDDEEVVPAAVLEAMPVVVVEPIRSIVDFLSPVSTVSLTTLSIGLNLGFRIVGASFASSPSAVLSRSQNMLTTFTPTPRNGLKWGDSWEDVGRGE